ncbi:flagellar assembly peptidoglycan hydrolase FlgJ [Algibacillus agarilyticus]|uniref:flagellar assembly peptidoglycan hydrolase FlgJ n=1 Tax=Algibacillus agarilyticus TaxID=2234133 RepID=UPI000DD016D9|nr:flagellar assembly peptidoglycan hydrolase FlgJ [Algibacillus agarilyticus]
MDKLEQTQMYHDTAGLDDLRQAAQRNDKDALKKAAQHFESIFMNMLLKSMRQANEVLSDKDSPFNSQAAKFYEGMHDDQMASELSSTGALGLADIIVQQLSPEKNQYMPASVMRSDGVIPSAFGGDFSNEKNNDDKNNDPLAILQIQSQSFQKHVLQVADEKAQVLMQKVNKPVDQDKPLSESNTGSLTEKHIPFQGKQDFVDRLLPIAEKVSQAIGLSPVAMIAQAALETGWGQKMIEKADGSNANNFFGIKADSRWSGDSAERDTYEFRQGAIQTEKAQFRAYDSIEAGLADYVSFIKEQPRYQAAVEAAQQPEAYFSALQQAGYATDPNYATKILNVLKDKVFNSATNMQY